MGPRRQRRQPTLPPQADPRLPQVPRQEAPRLSEDRRPSIAPVRSLWASSRRSTSVAHILRRRIARLGYGGAGNLRYDTNALMPRWVRHFAARRGVPFGDSHGPFWRTSPAWNARCRPIFTRNAFRLDAARNPNPSSEPRASTRGGAVASPAVSPRT